MPDLKERFEKLKGAPGEGSLENRFAKVKTQQHAMTQGEAGRVAFFDSAIDLAGNLPAAAGSLTGTLISGAAAGMQAPFKSAGNFLRGEDLNIIDEFIESKDKFDEDPKVRFLKNIPRPPDNAGEQIRAVASAADPRDVFDDDRPPFSDRLKRTREEEAARTEQARELFPKTFAFGDFVPDAAALLTGRAPANRARASKAATERAALVENARKGLQEIPPEVAGKLDDIISSRVLPAFKEVGEFTARGATRAGETGLEAAFFAALNDTDVETAFGLGASTQAAGSLSMLVASKPVKALLPAVGAAWVVSSMFQAAGPGEQDFFEAKDFAIQKAVGALTLGTISTMAGLGRVRGSASERLPDIMDAVTAVPRTVVTRRLAELSGASNEGNESPMTVMAKFATTPHAFSPDQRNALNRALLSEKEGAFVKEVNRLMNNEDFVRRLNGEVEESGADRLARLTPTNPIQRN